MITDNAYYWKITDLKRQAVIVRSEIVKFTNQFFFDRDFIFVEPPVLHESITNKKAEIYVPLYNSKYSLSSSNALFMGLYASEFRKVFTISKCFRDESDTLNHLVEFDILEVEVLNCTLDDILQIIKSYLEFVLSRLLESSYIKEYSEVMERLEMIQNHFAPQIITYDDFISNISDGDFDKDLDISDIDYLLSKQLNDVVIIVDYPTKFATWTAKKIGNGKSIAMNILLPESYGELCEGCERTNDIDLLQSKIRIANADKIQWYVDSVKQIKTDRCGFGLGIDRLVRWIIGADNISDTRFFPRVKVGG
ncbi:amino acid--tRNA ligase-related protein [Bengtsoniella intestinalis]|uniref:amino acid--tRNA ligase-related protein n=1 Tax=Bengtsoniella intestinalis TaxID=3073143 RepID=UPI00391F9695